MEHLWSPWRLAYINGASDATGCVFCDALTSDEASSLILHRGPTCFVILNLFPYNSGHLMVAPYLHTADLASLPAEVGADLLALTQRAVAALAAEYRPDGYNIGMNLGRVAGAGLPDHLHVHVVPRWNGDTNFMPVTAETKVLPETLQQTHSRLVAALSGIPNPRSS